MPTTLPPPMSVPTRVTSTYAVPSRKATSIAPPTGRTGSGRPLANIVTAPVMGSTRTTRPAVLSVTYSARPGRIEEPEPAQLANPATSRVTPGIRDGRDEFGTAPGDDCIASVAGQPAGISSVVRRHSAWVVTWCDG